MSEKDLYDLVKQNPLIGKYTNFPAFYSFMRRGKKIEMLSVCFDFPTGRRMSFLTGMRIDLNGMSK